ncbi:MAG: dephospho-CoA kinase [Fulvivirga sp.]|nr:dephospho-CoA kinase [Fulvivirga sp.]
MSKLQIGITGGIGSGKSYVSNIFKHLGIPVYDADSRAKWLMSHNQQVKNAIKKQFGEASYTEQGALNRKFLASRVFNDSDQVREINRIVHPAVGKDYKSWVKEHQEAPYLLKEAALMFESGAFRQLDHVIYVHAPRPLRHERIRQRDPQRTEKEIEAIMRKQLDEATFKDKSDFIIYNDEQQMLLPQVIKLHMLFTKN